MAILVRSCSVEDYMEEDVRLKYTAQKWQLVRMTGSFVNSETTGNQMEWQEYYVFKPDGTFLKSRDREGTITEGNGTFEVVEFEHDDADYLELVYKNGLELIGSCNGDATELLVYRSAIAISNTWNACDGPGLDYELVEN